MNSNLLRWLLDIDRIPKDADQIRLVWQLAWPGWLWTVLLLVAAAFAIWSYARLDGKRLGRGTLAILRFTGIAWLLILICGPLLEMPRERIEPDWVLALVDRSASMNLADIQDGSRNITRDEQLQNILQSSRDTWTKIDEKHHVLWLGFDAGTFSLEPNDSNDDSVFALNLDKAAGKQTWLGRALDQALARAAARPISGVVLFTDGRTSDPPSRTLLRRLQQEAIGIYALPLGSPDPVRDLAIGQVQSPRRAFIHDKVPITISIEQFGAAPDSPRSNNPEGMDKATVRLIDVGTGEELDRLDLPSDSKTQQVTLTAVPQLTGEATWRVVVETSRPDLIPTNNGKPFRIELIDRPLRVLYIDGYPRWEYRYLKNLLVREESIESSIMLLSADREFAQEGDRPITRLPNSPEEFAEYDVIIVGDVAANSFSPDQLDMMRRQVGQRGGGLLWIGGEHATPRSYRGTDLSDLLPLHGSLELERIGQPVTLIATPLAAAFGVLQLTSENETSETGGIEVSSRDSGGGDFGVGTSGGWPVELTDSSYGWSRLFYAQRITPDLLKPAAEVLGETVADFNGTPLPLVISMRYGTGLTMYVATDEIWRWRYGRGEYYPDQFWVQMIRALGRQHLAGADDRAVLETSPPRVAINHPVHIRLRLLDPTLMDSDRGALSVTIEDEENRPTDELFLPGEGDTGESYSSTWFPDRVGNFTLRIDDPDLAAMTGETVVEVFAPDDELRRPETDHELLLSLAASTGGRVLKLDEIDQLPGLLPKRSVTTENPLTERIWDTPLAFAVLLLILTMEWVGRKMLRLG